MILLVSDGLSKEALKRILHICVTEPLQIYTDWYFIIFMQGLTWMYTLSAMASSWTSAARLWRGLLCSIFPACMAAPTCGERPRRDVTTTEWVRNYLKGCVSAPSLMPRNLNSVCKVSQSLGAFQSLVLFIWESIYISEAFVHLLP